MSSPPSEHGTPAPFFARFRSKRRAVLALLSPPFLVAAVAWFWWASHHHVAPDVTELQISFFTACMLGLGCAGALIGIAALIVVPRRPIYDSACPCCGARAVRDYSSKYAPPACGSCAAYLRANGRTITEEREDAADLDITPYQIPRARYEPVARPATRDGSGLQFEMPKFCAVCGAATATHWRELHRSDEDRDADVGGAAGAMIGAALATAQEDAGMKMRNETYANIAHPRSARELGFDPRLSGLRVPVCRKHRADDYNADGSAIASCPGALGFASYRYYKAFCELNHVYPAKPRSAG